MLQLNLRMNTSRLEERLRQYSKRVRNLRPFFEGEASRLFYNQVRRVFESRGFGSWSPLSADYARRKRRVRGGKGILRDTDTYFRAATTSSARGSLHRATHSSLQIGVQYPVTYAFYHEQGTRNLPRRPVFALARERSSRPIRLALGRYLFRRRNR